MYPLDISQPILWISSDIAPTPEFDSCDIKVSNVSNGGAWDLVATNQKQLISRTLINFFLQNSFECRLPSSHPEFPNFF